MTSYFQDLIRLRELSKEPLVYQSIVKPVKMGNALPIAYGGYTSALAVQAAFHSLPGKTNEEKSTWAIYSANGLFLGPTSTEASVQYHVTKLRDTRSFATRSILASQEIGGKSRNCFTVMIDFARKVTSSGPHHRESKLPLSYSVAPHRKYPLPDELPELFEKAEQRFKRGEISPNDVKALNSTFGLTRKVTNIRYNPGDIFDETNLSITPRKDTAQQIAIPDVSERRSADYIQAKETLKPTESNDKNDGSLALFSSAIQASYLTFVLDGALAFLPLSQHGLKLQDAGACSTLDFSLRFHDDEFEMQDWHLREMRTYCSDRERTFSEALLFDSKGKLVVSTTQQCVLRPKPNPTSKL